MTKIKLLKHIQYGTERLYPGCSLSRAICFITRKKTISEEDAMLLTSLGKCKIEIVSVKARPIERGEVQA